MDLLYRLSIVLYGRGIFSSCWMFFLSMFYGLVIISLVLSWYHWITVVLGLPSRLSFLLYHLIFYVGYLCSLSVRKRAQVMICLENARFFWIYSLFFLYLFKYPSRLFIILNYLTKNIYWILITYNKKQKIISKAFSILKMSKLIKFLK